MHEQGKNIIMGGGSASKKNNINITNVSIMDGYENGIMEENESNSDCSVKDQ